MQLRLHDTLTRAPVDLSGDREVSLYVCGVTPYDTTHVGHARTYLVFDVLVRHLAARGRRVRYVQNITDVDESILARARRLGEPYTALRDRYTSIYLEDIATLGMVPADRFPRATSAIPEMQEVVRRLLASDHAYRRGGDVFFRTASVDYGKLSRLPRDEMLRIEAAQDDSTIGDERKEDPLDFMLWRAVRDDGPAWDSPWGPGRPGWHLECSTLALKHLGVTIDIHGGGADLVFPHHEAEVAQSEAVTGRVPFARCWMHVGIVTVNGDKMAKSAGNAVFVRELLPRHHPDALRLYLLSRHYRQPLDYDEADLHHWGDVRRRLAAAARVAVDAGDATSMPPEQQAFEAALDHDLDSPAAIRALTVLAGRLLEGGATYAERRALRTMAARLGLSLEPDRA